MNKSKDITNILIVGGGKGGSSLLELLIRDYTINIIGLVDINPEAPGIIKAIKNSIPVSKSPFEIIEKFEFHLDIIIDVTGSTKMYHQLNASTSSDVMIISNKAAKFIWNLIEANQINHLLEEQNKILKETLIEKKEDDIIYGKTPLMLQLRDKINHVAPISVNVLILGETGTGKELIASTIQQKSQLKEMPYLRINCSTLTTELLERELFGYSEVRVNGSVKAYKGLLEKADGGTVFLDEIGDVSLEIQKKILTFIQFGEVKPIDSDKVIKINTRLITATNKDLEILTKANKFRIDLFHRLNNYVISIPPLRDRKEDIPILGYLFLNKSTATLNKKINSISTSAIDSLINYDYPGNIRELQSIIERAVILCDENTLRPNHLSMTSQAPYKNYNHLLTTNGLIEAKENVIEQFERQAVEHYLNLSKGNVTKAANMAQTPKRSFYRMLEKYQIDNTEYKSN